jgi:hypothetical protein
MSTATLHKEHAVADKHFEVDLPEEVVDGLGWRDAEVPSRMREAVVMELLRRDRISEAEAAAFLGLGRRELLDVMGLYQVPAIRMDRGESMRDALKATAGAWKGLIDAETLKRNIYEDRLIDTRPVPKL